VADLPADPDREAERDASTDADAGPAPADRA
jgi:hypothetical protein